MPPLAIDWVPVVGGVVAVAVAALALVVIAPWRREDVSLDPEVEARLLLGEDPATIDQDLEQRDAEGATVADLYPEEAGRSDE